MFHVEPVRLLDGKTYPEYEGVNIEIVMKKVLTVSGHFYQCEVCSAEICRPDHQECPEKCCDNILQTFLTPEKHFLLLRDVVVHPVEWGHGVTDLVMVGGR